MAIRGTGSHEVKPDYATLHLSIYDLNRSSERAMEAHAKQLAKAKELLEELKRDGVEIKKSDFQLRSQQKTETIRSSNGSTTQKPIGPVEFVANTNYRVETRKMEELPELIGKLVSSGIFEISSLAYDVDNPRGALLQARKAAVTDAREQAEIYADAAGIRLVEVEEITDGEASRSYSDQADLPSRRLGGQWLKVTQIVPPATLNYNASVNIVWRIGPQP